MDDAAFRLPRVKVCGLRPATDLEALAALVERRAIDAVGLVEHPSSPRAVSAREARDVTHALTGALPIAVFVDRAPREVLRWSRAAGARCAQLCGDERPEDFRGFGLPLLRRVAVDGSAERELERWEGIAAGFVLDHPASPGGTGRTVDLELAELLARRAPCLLAGGLDPDNVAELVRRVRPAGVDASSRLEREPGIKDPERVARFAAAASAALAEVHA